MTERALIAVSGLVQGVGFRPFVHTLATSLGLRGFVQNRGSHVFVDIEGDAAALAAFVDRLSSEPPSPAAVEGVRCERATPVSHPPFAIVQSAPAAVDALRRVAPDLATCDDCRRELFDGTNRRYRHPFITCTACGPRFTVLRQLPYDRAATAMAPFRMCPACRAEYLDPRDRRFHAQAIACPQCGPTLLARDPEGLRERDRGQAALALAVATLCEGGIVAVKGLGGFHLACDATSVAAVAELRRRKHRDAKPLAVMIPDARLVRAGSVAQAVLNSRERPIVLVDRALVGVALAANVAPQCPAVGLLLPYTPVHHLLLHDVGRPLVMTSGNRRDEPMACDDDDAQAQLGGVADLFLTHDRGIDARSDDSVVRVAHDRTSFVRRSRGYAPAPLPMAERTAVDVLAVGGHLKNTFCLVSGERAYLSSHVGDLGSAASYLAWRDSVRHLTNVLDITPAVVAHDLHPDYVSTELARGYDSTTRVAVQHHHAHVLSCVAEHGCREPVIGVAFDGAGLGDDGAIWGGEFLVVEGTAYRRAAHLAYVPLPGGDAAAREPWRMALAHLSTAVGPDLGPIGERLAERLAPTPLRVVRELIARGFRAPPTSSIGRLFDAVASIAGLRDHASFEGQAAMELEACGEATPPHRYRFDLDTSHAPWTLHAAPVVRAIARDVVAGRPANEISAAFHRAVATMVADVAAGLARETGIRRVVLTGGVFQNALLARLTAAALVAAGLTVLEHSRVPCNDGGLSLGQALQAMRMMNPRMVEERPVCV